MPTVSIYVDGESERKRKRSKWAIPLIVGLAAAYAVSRTRDEPVVAPPPPPPVVTETIAPVDTVAETIVPAATTSSAVELPADPIPVPPPTPARPVFSPSRIDFGEGGRAPAQLATVRNEGGEPISLVSTTISGPFLATNGCANGVAPGAQCMVAVVFAPQQPGTSTGALTIVADGKRTRIPLRGSLREPVAPPVVTPPVIVQAPPPVVVPPRPVKPPARQLCFEPSRIHFKSVGRQSVTLTNPERTPLRVAGVAITTQAGVIASGYEVEAAGCMRVLDPGKRCRFTVRATELAIQRGERIELTVYYDDLLTGERRAAAPSSACAQR